METRCKQFRCRNRPELTIIAAAALLLGTIRCTYGTFATAPVLADTYLRDCDVDGNGVDCWPSNVNLSCCSAIELLPKNTTVYLLCQVNSQIVERVPVWQWVCPARRSLQLRCGYMADARINCNGQICPSPPCPWAFEGVRP